MARGCIINITYNGSHPFAYQDEFGHPATTAGCLHAADTIQWTLKDNTNNVDKFVVTFGKEDPFGGTKTFTGTPTVPTASGNVGGTHKSSYEYTVCLYDKNGKKIDEDDPKVQFDDGTGQVGFGLGFDPAVLALGAQLAWQSIFKSLQDSTEWNSDSGLIFFKYGLNDIEVEVDVLPKIQVKVKVSGP